MYSQCTWNDTFNPGPSPAVLPAPPFAYHTSVKAVSWINLRACSTKIEHRWSFLTRSAWYGRKPLINRQGRVAEKLVTAIFAEIFVKCLYSVAWWLAKSNIVIALSNHDMKEELARPAANSTLYTQSTSLTGCRLLIWRHSSRFVILSWLCMFFIQNNSLFFKLYCPYFREPEIYADSGSGWRTILARKWHMRRTACRQWTTLFLTMLMLAIWNPGETPSSWVNTGDVNDNKPPGIQGRQVLMSQHRDANDYN
jgi:hypothetical protein